MSTPSSSSRPQRPLSSLSTHRPTSSHGIRPSSSASVRRPHSSASTVRPSSSASTYRPISRVSHRPQSRHARVNQARLLPLCETLVTQVRGGDEDEDYEEKVEYTLKTLTGSTVTSSAGMDMKKMERGVKGHIEKARIHSYDVLADALGKAFERLKDAKDGMDELDTKELTPSRIPDHLSLLLALSNTPAPSTLTYASLYPPSPKSDGPPSLTWDAILKEEPFEGEHWNLDDGHASSSPSLSPASSDDEGFEESISSFDEPLPVTPDPTSGPAPGPSTLKPSYTSYAHRKELEALQERQYWREEWKITGQVRRFEIGNESTLGPTLHKILPGEGGSSFLHQQEKYLYEEDVVREVLILLQGRLSAILSSSTNDKEGQYRLRHLSRASQNSIIGSLRGIAADIAQLRTWAGDIILGMGKKKKPNFRTLEAFADAVDREIRVSDAWCAERESAIMRARLGVGEGTVVSLLETEKAIRDMWEGSFGVLVAIVQNFEQEEGRGSNEAVRLLDMLFDAVGEHLERGEEIAAGVLLRVFLGCAGPIWGMVGRWLRVGGGELEDEFFIEPGFGGVGIGITRMPIWDPAFWEEGYVLRDGEGRKTSVPAFIRPIATAVLSAGKGVGLLKALGIDFDRSQLKWSPFALVATKVNGGLLMLDRSIHDEVVPFCDMIGKDVVAAVMGPQCDLGRHLKRIEDLFFWRGEDGTLGLFGDVVFIKMDNAQQNWTDFHFLNTAFSDVATATWGGDSSLVRLSYRTQLTKLSIKRTVRALDGMLVEYAVPFPLTYVFTPERMMIYGEIFVLLMQVRRAKWVLDGILVRGEEFSQKNGKGSTEEMKLFWAVRGRLSWFVNTLLNFLVTYVVHAEILKFQELLKKAMSLDAIIHLHDEHLERVQGRCLLHGNTSALHRAILTILDMCLLFSETLIAFTGDTTSFSRHSFSTSTRHRSRRQRRQRRNVVSFSQEIDESSESSEEEEVQEPMSTSVSVSGSIGEDDLDALERLEKMSKELDGLVRFVRRGTESLASGSAGEAFGVLAFALEDWDA